MKCCIFIKVSPAVFEVIPWLSQVEIIKFKQRILNNWFLRNGYDLDWSRLRFEKIMYFILNFLQSGLLVGFSGDLNNWYLLDNDNFVAW